MDSGQENDDLDTTRVLSSSTFNTRTEFKTPLSVDQQQARMKKLQQRMEARREATLLKRQNSTKAKFDADETACAFTGEMTPAALSTTTTTVFDYDQKERQQKQLEAFSVWINHLTGADLCDTSEMEALLAKTKTEANKFLRDMLVNGGKVKAKPQAQEEKTQRLLSNAKMQYLRNRATLMFLQSPWPRAINTLVRREDISVRADVKVYSDIGLQTELLQLFLSFNPIWLQLGLEVITGKQLNLTGRRFMPAVTRFICDNILSDRDIMNTKKCAVGANMKIVTPYGTDMLHKHFITKVCHFLVAVELMRSSNLIPQMKCLFLKNSSYKCLADVYVMLSREVLSGSTNLPKVMKKVGFVSDFKQGFFEEHNYAVGENIVHDLHDGLILGKVVEIVGGYGPDEVIAYLRNPDGDRLRKIGNVRAVLQLAQKKGIKIRDVKPEKIVGGDVEALLELLWSIVGVYKAITKVQAVVRGFLARRRVERMMEEKKQALVALQEQVTVESSAIEDVPESRRKLVIYNESALIKVQIEQRKLAVQQWKRKQEEWLEQQSYKKRMEEEAKAITKVQAVARGFLARRRFEGMVEEKKQALVLVLRQEEEEAKVKAITKVQALARGFLARRRAERMMEEKKQALVAAQEDEAKAITKVQAVVRGFLARRRVERMMEEKQALVVPPEQVTVESSVIEDVTESPRKLVIYNESALIKAQAVVRGFLVRRRLAAEIEQRKIAVEQWLLEQQSYNIWQVDDLSRPIYQRTIDCLELLLNENIKVRVLSALFLADFVWMSLKCAEYVAANDGIFIILDAMDSLNRGMYSEEALQRLSSILLSLTRSRSPLVMDRLKKSAADIVERCFHHMYSHIRSNVVNTACGELIVELCERSQVPKDVFDKVKFHRKKLWEKCSKLPPTDSRRLIMEKIDKHIESSK